MSINKNVKVVILAAGMSSRLKSSVPKPLISLKDEKSILDFQLENISKYIPIDNIFLVVGFKKELIMEKYPDLIYVYNNSYAFTNTGKSLLRALKKTNSDTIWLNGDIVFDDRILKKLLHSKDSAIVVDVKECGEEEVKYTVNNDDHILGISKEIKNAKGEALGINLIKNKDILQLIKHLEGVNDHDYFEKAIENMIKKDKSKFKAVYTDGMFCKEIDFTQDLKETIEYVKIKLT